MKPEPSSKSDPGKVQIRKIARWIALSGATVFGLFVGGFLIHQTWAEDGFMPEFAQKQFGAMIMVPTAALIALCVVIILEWTAGDIKFKGLSFEFEGASGPIVLWVFCFLSIVAALRIFWVV